MMYHGKFHRLEPVINLEDRSLVGYDIHTVYGHSGAESLSEFFFMPVTPNDLSASLNLPFPGLAPDGIRLHIRLSIWALATGIRHFRVKPDPDSTVRVVELLHTELIARLTIRQRHVLDKNLEGLARTGYELWASGIMPESLDICGKLDFQLHGIKFHRNALSHGTWYLRELQSHSKVYAPVALMDGIDNEDMFMRAKICGARFGQGKLWADLTAFYQDGHSIPAPEATFQE